MFDLLITTSEVEKTRYTKFIKQRNFFERIRERKPLTEKNTIKVSWKKLKRT